MLTIRLHAAAALLATTAAISTPFRAFDAATAPGEFLVALHAEGAQIYHCKPDWEGKLAWQFREPVATLLLNGETVGRHLQGQAGRCSMEAAYPRRSRRALQAQPRTTFRCCCWR